ncbi:hypothetical protein [Thermococcus sp. 21S7]|uniref:immunoglobulin-like domain-containing protein n=1 Tax=Thermococcus sp. 21S7 TaxID=1638221 RepID=UPI00143BB293|nr:hypothetical protein [Thermococcus sp. 21S7]NJE61401.1 hypothetical protein [Thermococcus sp. 21S7]
MRIVKVPTGDRVGIIPGGIPPEVNLEITVTFKNGVLSLWISNPNPHKVEVSNVIELYQHAGAWKKLDLGLVFIERPIVLIPGETIEQKVQVNLFPGRYKVVKFAYVNGARVKVEKEFTV